MLYNELEQGDILSGVRWRLALLAYTDILLCSIWAIRRIRQTPVKLFLEPGTLLDEGIPFPHRLALGTLFLAP